MDTFGRDLKLARLDNLDGLNRLVAGGLLDVLDLVNDLVTLENLAENDVLAIEPTAMWCQFIPLYT